MPSRCSSCFVLVFLVGQLAVSERVRAASQELCKDGSGNQTADRAVREQAMFAPGDEYICTWKWSKWKGYVKGQYCLIEHEAAKAMAAETFQRVCKESNCNPQVGFTQGQYVKSIGKGAVPYPTWEHPHLCEVPTKDKGAPHQLYVCGTQGDRKRRSSKYTNQNTPKTCFHIVQDLAAYGGQYAGAKKPSVQMQRDVLKVALSDGECNKKKDLAPEVQAGYTEEVASKTSGEDARDTSLASKPEGLLSMLLGEESDAPNQALDDEENGDGFVSPELSMQDFWHKLGWSEPPRAPPRRTAGPPRRLQATRRPGPL